jgi:hypothetical protein
MLRLAAFGAQSASSDDPAMNYLQYALPIAVIGVISFLYFMKPNKSRRPARLSVSTSPQAT